MRTSGKRKRAVTAIMSGYCNTSHDVAEETGMSVRESSKVVSSLLNIGLLRDTGRRIHVNPRNCKLIVFEVAP